LNALFILALKGNLEGEDLGRDLRIVQARKKNFSKEENCSL
jgi:hypothetical protein